MYLYYCLISEMLNFPSLLIYKFLVLVVLVGFQIQKKSRIKENILLLLGGIFNNSVVSA
jgi:hypothetical protein